MSHTKKTHICEWLSEFFKSDKPNQNSEAFRKWVAEKVEKLQTTTHQREKESTKGKHKRTKVKKENTPTPTNTSTNTNTKTEHRTRIFMRLVEQRKTRKEREDGLRKGGFGLRNNKSYSEE